MHESGERGQFIQKKNFLLLAVNVYGRKIYEKMSKLLCKMHRGTCAFCWFWKWRENPADGIIFSYVNVYENHSLTGELGRRPIMKQVTIKDIAREAGVSIASVSRALNGMDGISEENPAGWRIQAEGPTMQDATAIWPRIYLTSSMRKRRIYILRNTLTAKMNMTVTCTVFMTAG